MEFAKEVSVLLLPLLLKKQNLVNFFDITFNLSTQISYNKHSGNDFPDTQYKNRKSKKKRKKNCLGIGTGFSPRISFNPAMPRFNTG